VSTRRCEELAGRAAVVVVLNQDGYVLAISRGGDVWDWGFPGGHAEPLQDCTIADAAFRELEEETGVVAGELELLGEGRSGSCVVTTYLAEVVDEWPQVLRSEPFEGYVGWVRPEALVAPTCRYRVHAREILVNLGLL